MGRRQATTVDEGPSEQLEGVAIIAQSQSLTDPSPDSASIGPDGPGTNSGAWNRTDLPELHDQPPATHDLKLATHGHERHWRQRSTLGYLQDKAALSFFGSSSHLNMGSCSITVDASSHASFNSIESTALHFLRKRISTSAIHDSADRFDPPKCDEDTREGLLEDIFNWIDDPRTQSQIAVITGPAGSGKSAIQQTICERYSQRNGLAGSFFFWREDPTRNQYHALFTTLIYQIAQSNKELQPLIEDAINHEPTIFDRSLEMQVKVLLINTVKAARSYHKERTGEQWPELLVVDGMDECSGEDKQLHVLKVIGECFVQGKLPFKIIIASRPEHAIRAALKMYLSSAYRIELHEHNASADIKLFLRRRLRALGAASNDPRSRAESWPTEAMLDELTENASGQFIYASTVVKFASNRRASPYVAIEQVLSWESGDVQRPKNPFAALDALYSNILDAAEKAYAAESQDERPVVGLLRELMFYSRVSPMVRLCIHEVEQLLRLRPGQVLDMLSDLHSLVYPTFSQVLHEDHDESDCLRPRRIFAFHHKSFMDYLSDRCRLIHPDQDEQTAALRLLRHILACIGAAGREDLDAVYKGEVPEQFDSSILSKPNVRLLWFCLYHWLGYLHIILSRQLHIGPLLTEALVGFFSSDGWRELKACVREGSISENMPEGLASPHLAVIWRLLLSRILVPGKVDLLHADHVRVLEEMRQYLEYHRRKKMDLKVKPETQNMDGDSIPGVEEEPYATPSSPSGSSEYWSCSED